MAPPIAPCRRVLAYPYAHTRCSYTPTTQDHDTHAITASAGAGFKRYCQSWLLLLTWLLLILESSSHVVTATTTNTNDHILLANTNRLCHPTLSTTSRRVWDRGKDQRVAVHVKYMVL